MQYILVTGSNGMLGRETVNRLLENGFNVMGISLEDESFDTHENFLYKKLDLTMCVDVERLFAEYTFSHIIHLAAMAHVNKGMDISWSRYYRINTLCSKTIFECAAKAKTPVFFASTIDVYGIQNDKINENTKPSPIGFYAKSKVLAEEALIEIAKQPCLIARFAPVYTESNKRDIYKRYYLRYPKIAYLIKGGIEYEFLSSNTAVSVIIQWVENKDFLYGVFNIADKQSYHTKKLLEEDILSGINPAVIKIPNVLYKIILLVVNLLFYKYPFYKFSAYKILKPAKFDKRKMLEEIRL